MLIVRGSTKNGGGTNDPPGRMGQQTPTVPVTPEDIARGYRISLEGEDAILPMPSGAVTNELLRRRGGYDWAFHIAPEGWRFPYRDGCFTGVTVEFAAEIEEASCSVELTGGASKVVMHENSQGGAACTSRRYNIQANRTVTKKFYLEGVHASGGIGDVQIRAEISGGGSGCDNASLTVYQVEVRPQDYISETLMNRHEVGAGEFVDVISKEEESWTS